MGRGVTTEEPLGNPRLGYLTKERVGTFTAPLLHDLPRPSVERGEELSVEKSPMANALMHHD